MNRTLQNGPDFAVGCGSLGEISPSKETCPGFGPHIQKQILPSPVTECWLHARLCAETFRGLAHVILTITPGNKFSSSLFSGGYWGLPWLIKVPE